MDFSLTEEQTAIQASFRTFAEREIRPVAADLDKNPRFPTEIFRSIGALGFYRMRYPEPDGLGLDMISYVLAVEEIARHSLAVAAVCSMQSLMGTSFVQRHAKGEVRERILGPALRGELVGTICMTEPDAGSDLLSMTTRAVQDGERWLISGRKTWITSAPAADFFTVFARTGKDSLSTFLVERGAAGLDVGRAIDKMGVRASITSEVSFDNTPATCILGEVGSGIKSLRPLLSDIRVMTAALALGVGRAAFEDAAAYARERRQFGKPIGDFQAIQLHLAEMCTDLEAARRLTQWAAWRSDCRLDNADQAAMAKLFASEAAQRVCDQASRVMASYGYSSDYAVERYLRDARFTLVGGGTSEILKINIAKGLAK